jgi:glycine cleavage system regulatory protein
MHVPLVMTLIGKDRPGLVGSLAALVAEHGGNWLECRLSHLGGHFAGILRVHVEQEHENALVNALQNLGQHGLTVVVHADEEPKAATADTSRLARLEVVGHDRPGIVREISRILSRHAVNVEEMESERSSAPMSGELLFKANATLKIPESADLPGIRADLEKIAADMVVDLTLSEISRD